MHDALVIGGGILGAATAYHLADAGADTLLVDRHDDGRATDAGAGILSPETSGHSDAWYDFAVNAVDYYPSLVEAITENREPETGYARCGALKVAVSEDEREAYRTATNRILRRRDRRDHLSSDVLYEVSSADAQERFPPLASVHGALYYEAGARVDGRLMTDALLRAAERRGLHTETASVDRILLDDGVVAGVRADGARYAAENVVIAGGAWSPAFGDQLNVHIPVEPQRGQIVHLDLDETDTSDWPIVSAFRGHYIVPWDDNRVAVGATRETGSGFEPRTTAAGVREVLDEALRVAPGLADAAIEEIRVGLRPLTDDGLPVIGPVPTADGVYLATGHGPTGLTLGPYTGKLVADLILGREIDVDLSPFDLSRVL